MLHPIDNIMANEYVYVYMTDDNRRILREKIREEADQLQLKINQLISIEHQLTCNVKTTEDLAQHVTEELSSERNASSLSKNQNDEQSTSPETDRHLAIANG